MQPKYQLIKSNKSAFAIFKGKHKGNIIYESSTNIKPSSNFCNNQDFKFESTDSSSMHSLSSERLDFMRQLKINSSLCNFKKKMFQIAMITDDYENILDMGSILIEAYDFAENQDDILIRSSSVQTLTENVLINSSVAVQTMNKNEQLFPNLADKDSQKLHKVHSNFQNQKTSNWQMENSKTVKKEGELVSDYVCTAFFEQQRNLLYKILESFEDFQNSQGSKFRGVSKNKSKWQVMIMGNFKKFYVGRIQTELEAAKMYDKLAIFYHGIQAKTNFQYTKEAILSLLSEPLPCVEMH